MSEAQQLRLRHGITVGDLRGFPWLASTVLSASLDVEQFSSARSRWDCFSPCLCPRRHWKIKLQSEPYTSPKPTSDLIPSPFSRGAPDCPQTSAASPSRRGTHLAGGGGCAHPHWRALAASCRACWLLRVAGPPAAPPAPQGWPGREGRAFQSCAAWVSGCPVAAFSLVF